MPATDQREFWASVEEEITKLDDRKVSVNEDNIGWYVEIGPYTKHFATQVEALNYASAWVQSGLANVIHTVLEHLISQSPHNASLRASIIDAAYDELDKREA